MRAVSCLLPLWVLSGGFAAEEEEARAAGAATGVRSFWDDPTLGGKLHLTYRAAYTAKVYDFKKYQYPFPNAVSPDDSEQARQLESRRDDRSDQDLDQYFSLRLEEIYAADGPALVQAAGGEASFRYFKDLDGSPPGEEGRGGFDRFAHRQDLQLHTLLVRLSTLERHLDLALGRQFGYEAEWLHFDGASATLRGLAILDREVEVTGFGGSRVTFYTDSASPHDGVGGGHLKAWLFEQTRLRLSDVHYIDNSLEVEVRQDLPSLGWIAAEYRMVNEDPHSVLVDANLEWPGRSITFYLQFVGKLGRNADDFDFDYTQSARRQGDSDRVRHFNIGDLEPYDELTLEVRKGLARRLGAYAGGTLHRLRARDREDNYNTDWQEAWLGLDGSDLLWVGLTGRTTVRYVHTDLPRRAIRLDVDSVIQNGLPDFRPEDVTGDGEPSYLGFEFSLEQDFLRKFAVGATAVLRSYDYQSNYAVLENLTAVSLGLHGRWRSSPRTQWLLSYSYDRDYRFVNPDLDSLHTVRLQFLLSF